MPREIEPSLNEKQFFARAVEENLRIDGRAFDQFRQLKLEFKDEYGVVDVSLGKTRVLTHITAEVVAPYPDRPFDGIFTITTELSPMASPAFEPFRPTETELLLSRLLEKSLRRSSAIDTESLCLLAGQKVWSVRADVHLLSHDGNLIDASCIAVIAALQHFRKPDTSIEGDNVTIYTLAEREPVPLSLLHFPLCVTFNFYADGEAVLLDATLLEEQLSIGSCSISMNRHGEVCNISKLGGVPVDAVEILHSEDGQRRNNGGLLAELSSENSR
ncbi:hypothetical protein B7463_g7173, partial [Scytalidium lignicola]